MPKWTLVCVIMLLAAKSRLLLGEPNTSFTPQMNDYNTQVAQTKCEKTQLYPEKYFDYQTECLNDTDDSFICRNKETSGWLSSEILENIDSSLKFRVAAFWPSSGRFRKIYGRSMASYQIEGAATLLKCYQTWINIDWINKKGHSYRLHYSTRINITNISFGLSYVYQFKDDFNVYLGLGPSNGYIDIHNRVTKQHKHECKSTWGLVVKSGVIYNINCHIFVEAFLDYLYQPTRFRRNVDVGGLKSGIGVGTNF